MLQRFFTGLFLILLLTVVLIVGGYLLSIFAFLVLAICVYEELHVMKLGGHRPVYWPAFTVLALSTPLMMFVRPLAVVPVLMLACFSVMFHVMRRKTPDLTDVMVSLLPILTVILPGLCVVSLLGVSPRPLQTMLLVMVFTSSVGSDIAALYIGTLIGGKKLCPSISPKKTISGAIGGLFGAASLTVLAGWLFTIYFPEVDFPPLWANLLVGLIGGIAGQFGDLLASLVKRYCNVKDFGTIFPGHGGMMDRMDSILFTSVVLFCYHEVLRYLG